MCVCVPIHSYMIHTLYIHLFSHSHKSYGEKKKGGEKKSLLLTNVLYVTAPLHSLRLRRAPESASPPQKKKKATTTKKKKVVPSSVLLKVARTLQLQLVRFHPEVCGWPCVSLFRGQRLPLHVSLPLHLPLFFPSSFLPSVYRRRRREAETRERHRRERKKGKQPTGTRKKRRQGKRKHKRQNGFFCRKNSIMRW